MQEWNDSLSSKDGILDQIQSSFRFVAEVGRRKSKRAANAGQCCLRIERCRLHMHDAEVSAGSGRGLNWDSGIASIQCNTLRNEPAEWIARIEADRPDWSLCHFDTLFASFVDIPVSRKHERVPGHPVGQNGA